MGWKERRHWWDRGDVRGEVWDGDRDDGCRVREPDYPLHSLHSSLSYSHSMVSGYGEGR